MTRSILWSTLSNRTLIFSKKITMIVFHHVGEHAKCLFMKILLISFSCRLWCCFQVICFFNNSILFSNWNKYVSLADVVTCFIMVPTWCQHWSMDSWSLHSYFSSLEMPFANLSVLYYLINKFNFFLHASIVLVNPKIIATMWAWNLNHAFTLGQ